MEAESAFSHTRREFIQAAIAFAGLVASAEAGSSSTEFRRDFEHGNPLSEFNYGATQFSEGLHQGQLDQTHQVLMELNEDSLLRPFRFYGGLAAPGFDLGGWYSSVDNGAGPRIPGHTFGQWISALSRYYAITGNAETKEKVFRLLQAYAETVPSSGELYAKCSQPAYVYDKLVCGIMDAYQFAGYSDGLKLLEATTAAALPHLPTTACYSSVPPFCLDEIYTIPENQFISWQRGANPRQLEMARAYLYDQFFVPLAQGKNVLGQRHAYSHMNALSSAAKAYLVLGDEKYLNAAVNAMDFVERQSFVTGGWGAGETFLPRPETDYINPQTGEATHYRAVESRAQSVTNEFNHFETPCGAYAHFKLTRYLLRITKNPRYGDSMERVMYNTVLGALPLNKFGKAFYQSNYHAHAHKAYFDGYGYGMKDEWPCCSGTLPQVAADYHVSTYFKDQEGVFVNLYIPSTLRWEHRGAQMTLTQSGQYPLDDRITIEVLTSHPMRCAIRVRVPAWADTPSIRINGRQIPGPVKAGTFAALSRMWSNGDRIDLELPRKLSLVPVDEQTPTVAALVCGPLVLFAIDDDTPVATRGQLLSSRQQGKGSPEWRAETDRGPLRLIPFWAIKNETYFTYLNI